MRNADNRVPEWMNRYPGPDITGDEFERFVVDIFESVVPKPNGYRVALKERMEGGTDGTFEFDATIRFQVADANYLTVVEAKRHKNAIKRELVLALHSKAQSVGAHKAVMVSTSKYQSGALEFAKIHGIALVSVTERRFTYETKSATPPLPLSRDETAAHFGLPTFVGHCYHAGETLDSTRVTLISTRDPDFIRELLMTLPKETSDQVAREREGR
jgi:hypothetical protein